MVQVNVWVLPEPFNELREPFPELFIAPIEPALPLYLGSVWVKIKFGSYSLLKLGGGLCSWPLKVVEPLGT